MIKDMHPLDQIDDTFSRCIKMAQRLNNKELAELLLKEMQHFKERALYLIVTGECSKGKSSLINAFLNEPGLCPVDAPSTTSNLTLIRWKETEQIFVHISENGESKALPISRDQIKEFVTVQHEKDNERTVQLLEINLPNPALKDGLILIDTPGLGTQNALHAATTFSMLPNADGAIFVSDSTSELTQEELDFALNLYELLNKSAILHVLTKIDRGRGWKKILEINKQHLVEGLGFQEEDIMAVGVSSTSKFDYDKNGDKTLLEDSRFPEFEQLVKRILSRSEIILGEKAQKIIHNGCDIMSQPLELEKFTLTESSKEKIQEIETEIRHHQDQLETLSNSPIWQLELNQDFKKLQIDVIAKLNKDFQNLRSKIENTYLEDNTLLNNLDQLENRIGADLGSLGAGFPTFLQENCERIYQNLIERTGLNLGTTYAHAGNNIETSKSENMKTGWGEKMLIRGRTIGVTTLAGTAGLGTVGAIIGGVVGSFIVPGAGTVAGATLGGKLGVGLGTIIGPIIGLFQGEKKVKERKKEKILKGVNSIVQDYQSTLQTDLLNALNDYETNIKISFLKEISMAANNCKRNLAALNSAKAKSASEAQTRLAEIEALTGALKYLKNEASQAVEKLKPTVATPHEA